MRPVFQKIDPVENKISKDLKKPVYVVAVPPAEVFIRQLGNGFRREFPKSFVTLSIQRDVERPEQRERVAFRVTRREGIPNGIVINVYNPLPG